MKNPILINDDEVIDADKIARIKKHSTEKISIGNLTVQVWRVYISSDFNGDDYVQINCGDEAHQTWVFDSLLSEQNCRDADYRKYLISLENSKQ